MECLVTHSTIGARREMSGGDLAVWPTERTVLAGRPYRMTIIIPVSPVTQKHQAHRVQIGLCDVVGGDGRKSSRMILGGNAR